jgi:hypothetical protein
MKKTINIGLAAGILTAMMLSASGISAQSFKLGDPEFAKKLCDAWNTSNLPKVLADKSAGGNNWINFVTGYGVPAKQPAGYQKIVSGRDDCKGWPKFELVVEKQADGTAKCTSAGPYTGSKVTWQFLPSTTGWFDYAQSFGYGAFMTLWWNGMIGDMIQGKANQGNFGTFFRIAGKIALESDYKTGCTGMNADNVEKARNNLAKAFGK